jgi:hypothetical protein
MALYCSAIAGHGGHCRSIAGAETGMCSMHSAKAERVRASMLCKRPACAIMSEGDDVPSKRQRRTHSAPLASGVVFAVVTLIFACFHSAC